MTKIIKFWQQFSFWMRIRLFAGSIGLGSQFAMYYADSALWLRITIGIFTVIAFFIDFFISDANKNNIIDIMEKYKNGQAKEK